MGEQRPDFVVLIADQLRAGAVGCFGAEFEVEARLQAELLRWMVATGDVLPWEPDQRLPAIDLPGPGEAPRTGQGTNRRAT